MNKHKVSYWSEMFLTHPRPQAREKKEWRVAVVGWRQAWWDVAKLVVNHHGAKLYWEDFL